MNISTKSNQTADACRFCWMCHHICPVGNATGQERNTARARGLAVSLVTRNAANVSQDMLDNMYECTLCGGCTNDCVTGWDPILFVKEMRTEAALNGGLPPYIHKMLDKLDKTGNVYGKTKISEALQNAIAEKTAKTETLLFLGMDARYTNDTAGVNVVKVLKRTKIDFTVLAEEPNSGFAYDFLIGAVDETVSAMKKCAEVLNTFKKVIVFDPADAKVFIREYKEYGVSLSCEIVTFTAFVATAITDGSLKINKTNSTYTYQDPALLAREVGETNEPRIIIKTAGDLKEMMLHGKETMFAGNTLMAEYISNTMKLIAKARWQNALETGADFLVTASPSEYAVLESVQPNNMKLISIEQLILQ